MKDDPKFNILFVKEVEKHPPLYISTVHGHVNKYEQEYHWKLVGEALNESSANCKEKWKNLRSSLCRHLRNQYAQGPGVRCKKSYYLAKHMEFLIPYIKIRQPGQYASVTDIVKEEEPDETGQLEYDFTTPEMEMIEEDELYTPTPEVNSDHHPLAESMSPPVVNALSPVQELHEIRVKKRKLEKGSSSYERIPQDFLELRTELDASSTAPPEDADLLFLKSLLPDMHKMEGKQKNTFKIMVLSAVNEILYKSQQQGVKSPVHMTPAARSPSPIPPKASQANTMSNCVAVSERVIGRCRSTREGMMAEDEEPSLAKKGFGE